MPEDADNLCELGLGEEEESREEETEADLIHDLDPY